MSVFSTRPIASPICVDGNGSCGTSPPGMNYDGGDCLPGFPGPIPTPTCGGYSSGSPYEGSPDCPECDDYCTHEGCWDVQVVRFSGSIDYHSGSSSHHEDFTDSSGFQEKGTSPPPTVTSSMVLSGTFKISITYTGGGVVPKKVRVAIFSSVLVAGSTPGSGSNGQGDPFNGFTSAGTHEKLLALDGGGHVEIFIRVNASVFWTLFANHGTSAACSATILPCEGS